MKAMILAAGLGTRLRPYTDTLAKPAIPFLNIPLFYYSVALLKSAKKFSIDEYVVNAHHKPEQIRALAKTLDAAVSLEKDLPLGSGGGVWQARDHFKNEENVFITNGDEVILPTHMDLMDQMLEQHQSSNALATILVKRDPRVGTQFGGVWANPAREVFGFGKQSPAILSSAACLLESLEGFHYVGVMILNSRAFQYFPEGESNILYDAMMSAIHLNEKVEIFIDDCRWFETGNIKDYLHATKEALTSFEKNPKDLFLNYLMKSFAPHAKRENLILKGENVSLDRLAKLSGFVVLGDGVKVPPGCVLNNVVVDKAVQLEARPYENDLILLPV
jgi:mannose-1-phosphate guanylyltransferase